MEGDSDKHEIVAKRLVSDSLKVALEKSKPTGIMSKKI